LSRGNEARRFQSIRQVCQARYYPLVLTLVFLASRYAAYAGLKPINPDDWVRTAQQIRNLWRGENTYCVPYCQNVLFDRDLQVYGDFTTTQAYSPWLMFFFAPLAYATPRLLVALTVAAWVVVITDMGRPSTLVLVMHPAFIMLWAAANADFLINGVGLWLIMRGSVGWRRGVALLLMGIKPHVLPLVLVLEGVRMLWQRDWRALLLVVTVVVVSVVLYPSFLLDTLPSYVNIARGTSPESEITLSEYPFSVFGAWGALPAAAVTLLVLVLMRHRLTEWRTLAVVLSLVWTPYINPYSFALLLILFYRTPAWRVLLYWVLSLATLPVLFQEYHQYERYGTLLFLLLAVLLTVPDPDQTEEALARQSGFPNLPLVGRIARFSTAPGETA